MVYDYCMHLGDLLPIQSRAIRKEITSDMMKHGVGEKTAKKNLFVPYRIMRREGFKEIYCNDSRGCSDRKECVVRKMIVMEEDLTEEAIISLVGKPAFEASVQRSINHLSEKAGYRIAEKNAKERAVYYWKRAMREGKEEALDELA